MKVKKILDILSKAGMVAPFTFVGACILLAVAVIADSTVGTDISFALALLSLVVIVAGIVATLFLRRWWQALGGVGALVVSLIIGLFFGVMIGAGQHHPPREPEGMIDTTDLVVEYEETDIEYEEMDLQPTD